MLLLRPSQAAQIADKVYTVRLNDIDTALELSEGLGLNDQFEIIENARFTGTSGPLFLKTETGFGYIATGVGKRQGELLIATRGTVPSIQDIATDLNGGLQLGPSGRPVHAGFNDTFSSFKNTLEAYFKRKSPTHVHCVGHSLGGALATLVADYVSEDSKASISLYTFGCPRVGTSMHSEYLTSKVGQENIKRVFFDADVVPMVPIFPFSHVPYKTRGIRMEFPGGRFNPTSHFMANYVSAVEQKDWLAIERAHNEDDFSIARWLENASDGGVMLFSAKLLFLIGRGLTYIISKLLGVVVGTNLMLQSTLLDKLAFLLAEGWRMGGKIANYIIGLFSKIFSFLGKVFDKTTNLTAAFVRWVLDCLAKVTMNTATIALRSVAEQLLPFEFIEQATHRMHHSVAATKTSHTGLISNAAGGLSARPILGGGRGLGIQRPMGYDIKTPESD